MPGRKLPDIVFPWSSNLAYATGVLATDGNLSKNGKCIVLHCTDLQLIKVFRACIASSAKISKTYHNGYGKKQTYRLQAGNVQLYRWFLTLGFTPAKTYSLGPIKIPNEYFRDFLRGHLDGDGSIIGYVDKYNTYKNPNYIYTRIWLKFISASEVHISWLQNKISELTGAHGHLWKTKKLLAHRVPMWTLKFGKQESILLLDWMYYNSDVPCLHRKRKKAEKLLHIERQYSLRNPTRQGVGRPRVLYHCELVT